MKQFKLSACLNLKLPAIVSFIGGGGKTTLMRLLAEELTSAGHRVLLTTTTKIYPYPGLRHFYNRDYNNLTIALKSHFAENKIAVAGTCLNDEGKVCGLDKAKIYSLVQELNISVLVEADGAKGKSLKGYRENEPLIPAESDYLMVVAGLDALGLKVSGHKIHRIKLFREFIGPLASKHERITPSIIAAALEQMTSLGLIQAPPARVTYLLNKYDKLREPQSLIEIANALPSASAATQLLSTSTLSSGPVKFIVEHNKMGVKIKVGCVILASGTASRMGQDKLALPFGRRTVLEATVENIITSGIEEIILVVQPGSRWPEIIKNNKVRIIENPDYSMGQSKSLIKGLEQLSPHNQGAMFALGDQPLIKSSTYASLAEAYSKNLKAATYPVYGEKRGNPVIFDRLQWPLLSKLTGDQGGRALLKNLSSFDQDRVRVDDQGVLYDLDTPEDYQKLVDKSLT